MDGKDFLTKRQRFDILEGQMRTEFTSFKSAYQDLSKYILPRRGRFFTTDVNDGDRKNTDIIDPTATLASRTLSSGMMTGITSPARAWFRLATDSEELNDMPAVKDYFKKVSDKIRNVFHRSNLYNVLPVFYGDLGTFSTSCIYMDEDVDDVVRFSAFPVGQYMIASNHKGQVRVFYREFEMSVRQIIERFGRRDPSKPKMIDWTNISDAVKHHYDNRQLETMITVSHIVMDNEDFIPASSLAKHKKYKSVYYEKGVGHHVGGQSTTMLSVPDKFLRESGYDYFPALCGRWEVVGEDTYGTGGPGMVCIGDVKQLQLGEQLSLKAVEHQVDPAMIGPTSLRNQKASIIPGDITYLDEREGAKGFRRLFEVDFNPSMLEGKQDQVRSRIDRTYYVDLFLMLAQSDRSQITATEIRERHEEKLLALGPVLERINLDVLDPLIGNTYLILERRGELPELPEELQGVDYKVEYISIMAQAQKLAGIGNIERLVGFVGSVAGLSPEIVKKLNYEEIVELYADLTGAQPNLLVSKEEMEAIREQAAQQAAAEQQAMQAQQMVDAGKTLSETKMNEDNALNQLIGGI